MTRSYSTIYRSTILSRKTELRDLMVVLRCSFPILQNGKEDTIYRPPDGLKYLFKNFNTLLNATLTVIIMGDININYLDKNNQNDIKDIFMWNGYKQLVTKATRITEDFKTLIDTILTNKPENIPKIDTILTSLSDHDMVGYVRKLNHLKYECKTIHCRNYKDYDPKALQKDLQDQSWVTYYSIQEPNSVWIYLKWILTHLFDKHAP